MWMPHLHTSAYICIHLHIAATCFNMNLSFNDFGHASSRIEFSMPIFIRPQMATPADFPSAVVMVQGPIAVLHPEFLAVCSVSAHSSLDSFASWVATKSAWVLSRYLLAPGQALGLHVSKAHMPSNQCCLLRTDNDPSSAYDRSSGPSGLGVFLVSLSLTVPGVVFGDASFASLGVASRLSLIMSFMGVQLCMGRVSSADTNCRCCCCY